jgi:hypothetical protein
VALVQARNLSRSAAKMAGCAGRWVLQCMHVLIKAQASKQAARLLPADAGTAARLRTKSTIAGARTRITHQVVRSYVYRILAYHGRAGPIDYASRARRWIFGVAAVRQSVEGHGPAHG